MKFGIDLYPHFSIELSGASAFEFAVRQVQVAHDVPFVAQEVELVRWAT